MDENKVFDEEIDEGEDLVLTLEMEDGTTEDCIVLTIFPMDDKQYIALLPVAQADDEEADVYLYGYQENGEDFDLLDIDEETFEKVAAEFESLSDEPL